MRSKQRNGEQKQQGFLPCVPVAKRHGALWRSLSLGCCLLLFVLTAFTLHKNTLQNKGKEATQFSAALFSPVPSPAHSPLRETISPPSRPSANLWQRCVLLSPESMPKSKQAWMRTGVENVAEAISRSAVFFSQRSQHIVHIAIDQSFLRVSKGAWMPLSLIRSGKRLYHGAIRSSHALRSSMEHYVPKHA